MRCRLRRCARHLGAPFALFNELLDRFDAIELAGEAEPWPTTFPGRIEKPPSLRRVPVRLHEAAT